MLILLKTMIVIFTFEMSFVKCVLSDHYVFLLQLLHSTMHIYLQNRCTNFSKQRIQKRTLHSGEEKGSVPFRRTRIPCSFCKTIYFATGPICLQHHLFVESYTNYYCSFCTLIHVKHVFIFFIVVTASVITTHWSLFLMRLIFFVPCQSMM